MYLLSTSLILGSGPEYHGRLDALGGEEESSAISRRTEIENEVRPAEGWRIQRESVPPGQKSGPCSLSRRQEGNQMI